MNNFKIKPLDKNQILISIDRLTRFKDPKIKYFRVFSEIITSNLIFPKYSKIELQNFPPEKVVFWGQEIINYSLKMLGISIEPDFTINKRLLEYEKAVFIIDEYTKTLIDNKINYSAIKELINGDSRKNLKFLKNIIDNYDLRTERNFQSSLFPIEKVILAEGATEEILLPEFAKHYNYDFDKNGVFLLSAGGKNQVVKMYYELSEVLELPMFILLDKDGENNATQIKQKLRAKDEIYLIKAGEFEDLLSPELVKRAINCELDNISDFEDVKKQDYSSTVEFLQNLFKNRGYHEFKKVEFAKLVKENIDSKTDFTPEIVSIIENIKKLKNSVDF